MDLTQLLVIIILCVSVVFMIVIGILVAKILHEAYKLIKRVHTVVDGLERVGSGLENGFNDMAGFVGGMKSVFKILEIFKKRKSSSDERSEESTS